METDPDLLLPSPALVERRKRDAVIAASPEYRAWKARVETSLALEPPLPKEELPSWLQVKLMPWP